MRRRNETPMDPETERDLAVIDDALAGRVTDPADAELAELALLIAAERPPVRPQWAREMDARVAARFPNRAADADRARARGAGAAAPRTGLLARVGGHPWLAGASTAAVAGMAAIIVISSGGGASSPRQTDTTFAAAGSSSAQSSTTGAPPNSIDKSSVPAVRAPAVPAPTAGQHAAHPQSSEKDLKRSAAGATGVTGTVPPLSPSTTAGKVAPRRVERSTELTLAVKRRDMQSAGQQVFGIVTAAGGVVSSSNVAAGQDAGATFDLRIPSARLQATLARLVRLGHVRSENDTTLDITSHFTSAQARLADAKAERAGLLRQLAKAVTPNQTDSIKGRLRLAESHINAFEKQLASLRTRTDFSHVSLSLVPASSKSGPTPVHHGSSFGPGSALHTAGHILAVAGSAVLLVLAIVGPLAALALIAWIAARPLLRRRREQVLDAAL